MRTGATKEHYDKQKSQAFAYFKVGREDAESIAQSQFTIYNFITNSFAFSPTKKELTLRVLEELKHAPLAFSDLVKRLGARKSTLYLLCLSLERSGLIEREKPAKNTPFRLSPAFSSALREYAAWWEKWLSSPPESGESPASVK